MRSGRSGAGACAPQQLFAHALAPGPWVRAFFLLLAAHVLSFCLPGPGCPAFPFDLEIARTPPGTANQDVNHPLPRGHGVGERVDEGYT
jgi:hypothetical protein